MINKFAKFSYLPKSFRMFGSTKNHSLQNSNQIPDLKGQQQMKYMSQYQRSFFYLHSKQKKLFSLYTFFSVLPISIVKHIAKTTSDPQTTIASDQLNLPKIVPHGIPIYDSLNAGLFRMIRSLQAAYIPLALFMSNMPFLMLTAVGLHWFIYYKSSFGTLFKGYVVKMQLNPSTEQILYQKIGPCGCITTHKVSLNSLEYVNKKDVGDRVFRDNSKSSIDQKLIFKIKDSGQLLMFDREGLWYEQGLKHQLMI